MFPVRTVLLSAASHVLTRTRFNRSPLVRCLEGLGLADVPDAGQTLAERLGQWLDWRDAIALFDALQGCEPAAVAPAITTGGADRTGRIGDAALREDLARVRAELARDIASDSAFTEAGVDAATCRAHHAAHQRAMEGRIGPLRDRARAALAAASPELARLAALDALMDQALAVRERQLLANVPVLLEQQAARAVQAAALAPSTLPTPPTPRVDGRALQRALAAELVLRLEAIEGLLAALTDAQLAQGRNPAPCPT